MSIETPSHREAGDLSGRFLRWLANPVRRRKMRSLLRGSLLGICIGSLLFAGWVAFISGPLGIFALIIAFMVSFVFIHLFVCAVVLPLYLRSHITLSPATGAIYGGIIGAAYSALFSPFHMVSLMCGGVLTFAYGLPITMLEPWHTALIFGTSYGLLVGLCAGILETTAVRLRVGKGF